MAKQIAVVLSQSPLQNAAQRDFEETLVAQLLMEDGLEVTIVPHLQHLDEQSTGRLCLEGVTGDMILLAAQPPLETDRQLRELGLRGRFGRTAQTADVPQRQLPADAGPRTLYSVDLSAYSKVDQARREVLRIRDEAGRSVMLLGDFISGGSLAVPPPASPPPPPAAAGPRAPESPAADAPPDDRDALDRELDGLMDEFEKW